MSESLKSKTLIAIVIAGILLASSTSMPVANAQSTQTSLTIAVPYNPPWLECTIAATLKDENENPLQNMDIDFFWTHTSLLDGTDCVHLIGTATTDSNGVASLTNADTLSYPYTYRITANFSGTTTYALSGSEYVDIIIVDYTLYLVGGGLLAVVIIAGYLVVRRRKKAITIPEMAREI